jgi:hypothetical protein
MRKVLDPLGDVVVGLYVCVVHGRLGAAGPRRDRGDVPGWVLVTIMTAGLVTALWLVADDKLTQLFNNALDGVAGSSP